MSAPRAAFPPTRKEGVRVMLSLALVIALVIVTQTSGIGWDTLELVLLALGLWQAAELLERVV